MRLPPAGRALHVGAPMKRIRRLHGVPSALINPDGTDAGAPQRPAGASGVGGGNGGNGGGAEAYGGNGGGAGGQGMFQQPQPRTDFFRSALRVWDAEGPGPDPASDLGTLRTGQ